MAYNVISFVFILNVIKTSISDSTTVPEKIAEAKIVPDIIPIAPSEDLTVTYPWGISVNQGNELSPQLVMVYPFVKWNANPSAFYTLCMIDADCPTARDPNLRPWQHWLVVNIPGYETDKGDTLSQYIGAFPIEQSGIHRYVFLVYQQLGKLTFDEPRRSNRSTYGRSHFEVTEFAAKYQLGNPVAGNFFTSQWDKYSIEVHSQLYSRPINVTN